MIPVNQVRRSPSGGCEAGAGGGDVGDGVGCDGARVELDGVHRCAAGVGGVGEKRIEDIYEDAVRMHAERKGVTGLMHNIRARWFWGVWPEGNV